MNHYAALVERLSREPEKSPLEVATLVTPMQVSAWLDRQFAEFGPEGGAEAAFAEVSRSLETGLLRHLNIRLMLDAAASGRAEVAGRYMVAAIRDAVARDAIESSNNLRWLEPLRSALSSGGPLFRTGT